MGLLGKKKSLAWEKLSSSVDLDTLEEQSKSSPVVIFKHSTRCSISSMALSRLERDWNNEEMSEIKPYYLDLISYRSVSNEIADRYGVYHQSPQLLVIKDGKCHYDDSHMNISYGALKSEIEKLAS